MLAPTLVGLGQTSTPNYKCNATICYGTDGGTTHALFKEFQYQLNRAGARIGVDGFIGAETLKAYNALAMSVKATLGVLGDLPTASSFTDLSSKIVSTGLVHDVTTVADTMAGKTESAVAVRDRAAAASQEGHSTTSSTPVRSDGSPLTLPPVGSGRPGMKAGVGLAVGVTAGLAAIGLVGVAIYQRRKRRR